MVLFPVGSVNATLHLPALHVSPFLVSSVKWAQHNEHNTAPCE